MSEAAEPADEKLLLGFEEEDFARLGKAIKITRKEGKTKEGKPYVAWESPGGFRARPVDGLQGQGQPGASTPWASAW